MINDKRCNQFNTISQYAISISISLVSCPFKRAVNHYIGGAVCACMATANPKTKPRLTKPAFYKPMRYNYNYNYNKKKISTDKSR